MSRVGSGCDPTSLQPTSLGVQGAADPDDRGALLGRDAVVLRGAHGEVAQAVLAGQLAQSGEVRAAGLGVLREGRHRDRKSTRLNSSHLVISYAVFSVKKNSMINVDMYSR